MPDIAIRVENLSKLYHIGALQQRHDTLRDALSGLFRRDRSTKQVDDDTNLWALRDISFEVKRGEVVGIIGRNGAGKSTLLKILSRITEPTRGIAEIHGRVGSLLEVGTGFHPELTGRENIYLNGALLGMHRSEIDRKFDEIVAFAETEQFLDTPVKRYSSGMYVRLAFAVAAHLELENMLIDEVLAVGDARFQKKCLGKMQEVSSSGRTILFVSHDMSAIARICERTILLNNGSTQFEGLSHHAISAYLRSSLTVSGARKWPNLNRSPGNENVRLRSVELKTEAGDVSEVFDIRRPIGVTMEFEVLKEGHILVPNCHLHNEEGIYLFAALDSDPNWRSRPRPIGRYRSTAWIPGNMLSEGSFLVSVAVSTFNPFTIHFHEKEAVVFRTVDSMEGDSARGDYAGSMYGAIRPLLIWTTEYTDQHQTLP